MNFSQTELTVPQLRAKLKKHGISYRRVEDMTKTFGYKDGNGYSYSLVRKVLVDETRDSGKGYEAIKKTAQKMIDAMEAISAPIAA
ncbi:MAG: hypothetical protein ACWA44_02680 [Thiotrichales bacterium]